MLQLFTWSIISGNRYPIFRIMLYGAKRQGKLNREWRVYRATPPIWQSVPTLSHGAG